MKCLNVIAFILVVLGAINWGLWGFFQFDFVAWLFHGNTVGMSRVIYAIIGLAGVWCLGLIRCCCKRTCGCGGSCSCSCCSGKNSANDKKGGGCCR